MKNIIIMGGVPAEIQLVHLPNTSPEHYRYINLLGAGGKDK
jgi:hypothetical protein